jgi:hypothetical protein
MRGGKSFFLVPFVLLALTPGRPAASRPAGSLKPSFVAQQLMTAIVGIKRWSGFLYGLPTGPAQCEFSQTITDNGDGTFSVVQRDEQCAVTEATSFPDGSFEKDVTYPGKLREHVTGKTSDFLQEPNLFPQRYAIHHTLNNGNSAEYEVHLDLQEEFGFVFVAREQYAGEFRLGRKALPFTFTHSNDLFDPVPDQFHVTMPGDTILDLAVPFDFNTFAGPDFAQPTTGTLTLKGKPLTFTLISDDPAAARPRWTRLVVGAEDQPTNNALHGEFVLDPDYGGRGQMFRGERLEFATRWNGNAVARVLLPNGQVTQSGPTAGILDFSLLRWSGLASVSGPVPGVR